MTLAIERPWVIEQKLHTTGTGEEIRFSAPVSMWWGSRGVSYGPGYMLGRYANIKDDSPCTGGAGYRQTLTRFTFTSAGAPRSRFATSSPMGK